MRAVWISLALHAAVLGGGWFLVGESSAPGPEPLVMAHVEILEPRTEASIAPDDELPPELLPQDAEADPLDAFEPIDARLQELVLPEDPDAPTRTEPVDLPDIPLEVVKVRVRPQQQPPPAPPPVSRPAPARPPVAPAKPRKGRPLRVVRRPDVMRYYPAEAQRRGIEGTALVEIRVDRSGVVVDARIVRSSGFALLDDQALRVMYDHRFAAGDGGRARVPVAFTLR